jgi:hypothetical protein
MFLGPAGKMITPLANSAALERETALETSDVHATCHLEIDRWFHFFVAPAPSYKFAMWKDLRVFVLHLIR